MTTNEQKRRHQENISISAECHLHYLVGGLSAPQARKQQQRSTRQVPQTMLALRPKIVFPFHFLPFQTLLVAKRNLQSKFNSKTSVPGPNSKIFQCGYEPESLTSIHKTWPCQRKQKHKFSRPIFTYKGRESSPETFVQ